MKLRGAVYGCGMISEFHLRGWRRIPEVEIVALGNRTLSRAEERRAQFAPQAPVFSDLAEMLRAVQPDFVDILTAPRLHREHCSIARQAGVHVICQKPLADTLADAQAIASDFQGYDKLFAIHENHRYRPWFQRTLSADLGSVEFVHIQHLNATHPGETYKNESETGVYLEYGSHLVDMMRALMGEPDRVYARFQRLNAHVRGESLAHVVHEYPNATAVIDAGWKNAAITQGSVLVAGSAAEAYYEGTLTRGENGRFRVTRGSETVLDETRSPLTDYVDSFYGLQRECADFMLGHRPTVQQTAAEHLKTLRLTFAAYKSAETGEAVTAI
ncbi:MAG TPA: Gfo/Idh/MocA family oxidoreductase [Bryobacteraceae bacterium]|nr:Gfo/Idh/MocA family oxidoreductase [Bryobacteraceae bacterium]